jgi:glycosyltransferase involved in cell wall biosynthesis
MKLCYVTSRYRPHTGGIETHVSELATRFADRGHDVTVVAADSGTRVDGRRLPAGEVIDGVEIRRVRAVAPGGAIHVAPGVMRAVKRCSPDLVHAHNYHSLPLAFAASAVDTDCPFVVTPHYHASSPSSIRNRLLSVYRPVGSWALHRADRVVAVSAWEAEQLAADFDLPAQVVPNGIHVDRFRTAEPASPPGDRPYLLCVGRLEQYKGVQHVIRALPELPTYDLVVAGDGPYADALRQLAQREGVADRVFFEGYVPDSELPGLYAGATAYVTMSAFEAYGITVAEALAAGTPCVVRRAGALVDWADRTDCVGVTPDELCDGVAAAVGRSAPSDELPTWEKTVDEVATVYDELR